MARCLRLVALAWALLAISTGARVASGELQAEARNDRCIWADFELQPEVSAWEMQAEPHRHQIRNRDKAISKIEALLKKLSADPKTGITFVPGSRWMAIFDEEGYQVSSRHGHPLHRERSPHDQCPFPWKGLAYLRTRTYRVLVPAGAYVPTAQPGTMDVALKMKNVEPQSVERPMPELELPQQVGGAKLSAKLENDIHCDHDRLTFAPIYKPIPADAVNVSTIRGAEAYFPNLAKVALLEPDEPLLFMHRVWRAKIVWTVVYAGVVGEAGLVIKYNTSFQDAVAGRVPKNGEISLRIRREVAHEHDEERLRQGLAAVARGMDALRAAGWDGKTPSLNDSGWRRGAGLGRRGGSGGGGGVPQLGDWQRGDETPAELQWEDEWKDEWEEEWGWEHVPDNRDCRLPPKRARAASAPAAAGAGAAAAAVAAGGAHGHEGGVAVGIALAERAGTLPATS